MTLPLPRRGRHQPAHDRRHRPEVAAPPSSRPPRSGSRSSTRPSARRAGVAEPATVGRRLMDLHLARRRADRAERAARRRAARRRRRRLGRRRARSSREGHIAQRRPRGARAPPPAAAGAAGAAGARRLDQPRRARTTSAERLTVPPAEAYGVATFYALLASSRGRRASCTSATTSPAAATAREELIAQLEERFGAEGERSTTARRPGCAARASACATARPAALRRRRRRRRRASDVLAPVDRRRRARRRSPAASRGRRRRSTRCRRPATPALRLLRRVGRRRPDAASTTTAPPAATRRCGGRIELGAGGRDPRGQGLEAAWAAAARRSRPAQVGGGRARSRRGRTTSSATPTSPSPARSRTASLMEGDPFALVEAMTIAAFATGCERGYIYLRGEYPRRARTRSSDAIDEARAPRLPRATTSSAQGFASTSRSARRRRLHLRRGDGDLQLDRGLPRRAAQQAAVPGRRGPVRQADGRQQRRDAGQRARRSCSSGGAAFAEIGHRELDRHRSCSASPATSSARASTRCRSARRCASCSTLAGGVAGRARAAGGAARRRRRRLRRARTSSTCRSPSRARARPATTLGSGVVMRVRRHASTCRGILLRIAAFFRDESCGQCVPCRVGTVRQEEALARLVSGRTRGGVAATSWRCSARSASACATRRSAGSARRRRARSSRRSTRLGASFAVTRDRSCSRRSGWSSSTIDGQPVRVPRGRDDPRRLPRGSGSTRRRSATARRCSRPTSAASAWSSSRARASLVPACSRKAEDGMKVHTDSERVRPARKLVLELLGLVGRPLDDADVAPATSSATTPTRSATGRRRRPTPRATARAPGHHVEPDGQTAATVRAAGRRSTTSSTCATTPSASSVTSASTPAASSTRTRSRSPSPGRGFDARISTEFVDAAARVGLRLLRQLHRRLPDRRADVPAPSTSCARRGDWDESTPDRDRHDLPVLRRRLQARRCTCRTTAIVKVTSPGRPRRHARQPLHQGALRLRARPGARRRPDVRGEHVGRRDHAGD